MADLAGNNGECPVLDKSPPIFTSNKIVVDIFRQAEGSGARIESNRKTYVYLRPADVGALLDMYDVNKDDRPDLIERLNTMQGIANELRPRQKAPKKIK